MPFLSSVARKIWLFILSTKSGSLQSYVYAPAGSTSADVWFNIGGSGSGYPYVNIYKFVVKLDGNTIFNDPNFYPQFYATVSGIGSHTIFIEMWEDNYLGQHVLTTTRTTTFTLESSYIITALNSFGTGGSMKIDTYETEVPAEGVTRIWGKNTSHTLEAINNQTINELLRTWNQWTFGGSSNSNIQMTHSVTSQTTFTANFHSQPTVPTNFQNADTSGNIQVSWSANPESDIQYYELERKLGSGSWTVLATQTNTTYTDYEVEYDPNPYTHQAFEVVAYYRIRSKSTVGLYSAFSNTVTINGLTIPEKKGYSIQENNIEFSLNQNYPNPFNPTTEIRYGVADPSFVTLIVFNSAGQQVEQLVKEFKGTGNYSVTWNATHLPSGIYFYSITANKFTSQKKMVLTK